MQDQKTRNHPEADVQLPTIPDKLYFTIGEAAKLCDLKTHVLRYWEQEFVQLKPSKRRGNRRYYQRKDVILIWQIKNLLYQQGYTIEGARAQLASQNIKAASPNTEAMQQIINDLNHLLENIEN